MAFNQWGRKALVIASGSGFEVVVVIKKGLEIGPVSCLELWADHTEISWSQVTWNVIYRVPKGRV